MVVSRSAPFFFIFGRGAGVVGSSRMCRPGLDCGSIVAVVDGWSVTDGGTAGGLGRSPSALVTATLFIAFHSPSVVARSPGFSLPRSNVDLWW